MKEISISDWMMIGLMVLGYLFILIKAFEWLVLLLLKKWDKKRKQDRRQRAVNELYDAFELDTLKDESTIKVAIKGDLNIFMCRGDRKP
ncbi:DUF4752 family protein [Pantoea stewartii]|uniref:DUF4752 family protein n=1 Tax=Pantoea stewartii TaxID=66269 RepID=UPI00197F23E7|nr:DUF4752 family protein [Pantoea stewartii]